MFFFVFLISSSGASQWRVCFFLSVAKENKTKFLDKEINLKNYLISLICLLDFFNLFKFLNLLRFWSNMFFIHC